jgi:hypothetical protein
MYKDGVLTISEWTKGMGDSSYTGFSTISNCEVFETPSVLKIANRTTPYFSTSFTGLPIAYVEDSYGNNYTLTDAGVLYKNGVSLQTGLNNPWDLAIYNNYLIVTNSTVVQAYGPLNSSPIWFGNWKTGLNGVYYAKMLVTNPTSSSVSSDLYIANGDKMAKVSDFTAGAVGVAPTATFSTNVMLLPLEEAITTMIRIGTYVLIGTQSGNGSWANAGNGSIANIYLWDKSDTKITSLVGELNESHIQAMVSNGNRAYIMAGTRGNLYLSDTTSFTKIKRLPWNQNRLFGATMKVYPNAIALNVNNNILIGTSTLTDAYGADPSPVQHGVYEVSISKDYPTVFKQQISSGNKGQTQNLKIGFVYVTGSGTTILGWQDGSTYGLDTTDFRLYTNSVASTETQLFLIGTRLNRKTFQNLEFLLGKPLITGQEITISYRKNLTDDFTQIGNFTYTSLGGVISHNTKALLDDIEVLQLKIELTQPINTQFGNNIELLRLTIW